MLPTLNKSITKIINNSYCSTKDPERAICLSCTFKNVIKCLKISFNPDPVIESQEKVLIFFYDFGFYLSTQLVSFSRGKFHLFLQL